VLHMADPPVRHGDGRGDGLERQQGAGPGCPERHASCQRRGARTVTRRSKPPPSTRGAGLRMGPTRRAPSARVAQEHGRHSCKAETAAGAAATIRGPRPMPGWARMGAAAAYWTRGGLRTEDPLGRQRDAHQAQESGATVRRDGRRREDAAQRRPRASARRIAHCPWASLLTHRGRAPPPWDKQKILFGKKIVQLPICTSTLSDGWTAFR
jgi:hypothetical protein